MNHPYTAEILLVPRVYHGSEETSSDSSLRVQANSQPTATSSAAQQNLTPTFPPTFPPPAVTHDNISQFYSVTRDNLDTGKVVSEAAGLTAVHLKALSLSWVEVRQFIKYLAEQDTDYLTLDIDPNTSRRAYSGKRYMIQKSFLVEEGRRHMKIEGTKEDSLQLPHANIEAIPTKYTAFAFLGNATDLLDC
ncbi:hypothetical protein DFH27DRAFT_651661 [Peziza echinospora]|nr:hypothetical protein DFH27DRAFT_651661 [Peziza echinospora]